MVPSARRGQTATTTIQATGSVTCRPGVRSSILRSCVGIYSSITPLTQQSRACSDCSHSLSVTSLSGARPGTRYCAIASANHGIHAREGFGTICITT